VREAGGRDGGQQPGVMRAAVAAPSSGSPFPALIPLPAGFGPEGIAVGNGSTFYVGSLTPPTLGQILVGDLRTGEFAQLVAPTGRPAVGMKHDSRSNLLFVAGGASGRGTVYDAFSGDEIAFYQFQPPGASGKPRWPSSATRCTRLLPASRRRLRILWWPVAVMARHGKYLSNAANTALEPPAPGNRAAAQRVSLGTQGSCHAAAHRSVRTSACSNTVCVAFSCLSGG
jgi:hypothetical protein